MILKYQSPRKKSDGTIPEPIFFDATTDNKPMDGFWRCEPMTDSWSLKNNPNKRRIKMPAMVRTGLFNAYYTEIATDVEVQEFLSLKKGATMK